LVVLLLLDSVNMASILVENKIIGYKIIAINSL